MPRLGRLEALLGRPLSDVGEADLETLFTERIHESNDLDFKNALYGNRDQDRKELASDVA